MMMVACSLFDTKAGIYGPPIFVAHEAIAVRSVQETAQDRRTLLARHPADFSLLVIGTYDDATGVLSALPHRSLGSVVSLLPAEPQRLDLLEEGS